MRVKTWDREFLIWLGAGERKTKVKRGCWGTEGKWRPEEGASASLANPDLLSSAGRAHSKL